MKSIRGMFLIVLVISLAACGHMPRDVCYRGLNDIDNFRKKDGVSKLTYAAWAGNPGAQNLLGRMYLDGAYVSDDLEQSFFWTEKAAKNGHPHAQVRLGIFYSMSLKTRSNYLKMEKWFRKAAEQGNVHGSYNYALLLYQQYQKAPSKEQEGELKALPQTVVRYMRYAAEKGLVEAKYNMARYYQDGFGVEAENPEVAVSWLKQAAKHKDFGPAYFALAWAYKNGWGVEKDIDKYQSYMNKRHFSLGGLTRYIVDKNKHTWLWSDLKSNDFNAYKLRHHAVINAFASTFISGDPKEYESAFVAAADVLNKESRTAQGKWVGPNNWRIKAARQVNYPACRE